MPKVSIITPLYNGAEYIAQNIASVQAQTFDDYEHLVIDNRSNDGGPEIVAGLARSDARIRLLSNSEIPGAAPTRNRGILEAAGRYIAFLDCDDAWHPEKLEKQIALMERDDLAFSWTAYDVTDAEGSLIRVQSARPRLTYRDFLLKRTSIGCLTAIYDAEALGKIPMTHGDFHEDFCLWLDVIREADARGMAYGGLPESLASYRVHKGSKSANKVEAAKMHWRSCRQHLKLDLISAAYCFAHYAKNAVRDRSV